MMLLGSVCIVCLLAVSSLTSGVAGRSSIACPVNSQYFISEDRTLLPLANAAATSEDAAGPVTFFINSNSPWCTSAENASHPGHHINLTFTEPVVLTLIQSGGFFNGYVNNFSLAYAANENDELTRISQNFVTDDITLRDAYFVLERPIALSRLQLPINGGILDPAGRLCWEVLLFGCTLTEAIVLEPEGIAGTVTTPPTTTPTPTPTLSQVSPGSPDLTQDQLLVIAVPVAVGTVVVVLVIVAVGVILCAKIHKNARIRSEEQGYEKVTVKVLDDSHLYQRGPRASRSSSTDTLLKDSTLPRDSMGTLPIGPDSPGQLMYDVPRPLTYDIPRGTRSRSNSSCANNLTDLRGPLHERPRSTPLEGLEKPSADYDVVADEITEKFAEYDVVPDEIIENFAEKKMLKDKVAKTTTPSSIPLELETSAADYDEIPDDFIPEQHTAKKHVPGVAKGPDPSHVYTKVNKSKTTKDSASSKPHLLNTII